MTSTPPGPATPDLPRQNRPFDGIRLEHISFGYQGRQAALRDVSLDVPRGKTVALVGLSGSGKSTIASLLMRFYDLEQGRILLEGWDYTLFPAGGAAKAGDFGASVGEPVLRHHCRETCAWQPPNATRGDMLEALDQVRLGDWVRTQPLGLDTPVGDAGAKLSGGQRQKLGIARALLCRAEYIIFDEATSSVDMESEREIWNCIEELAQTRTLVLISHRLSTIRSADVIYVLENGAIAQQGSHGELMAEPGLYPPPGRGAGTAGTQRRGGLGPCLSGFPIPSPDDRPAAAHRRPGEEDAGGVHPGQHLREPWPRWGLWALALCCCSGAPGGWRALSGCLPG